MDIPQAFLKKAMSAKNKTDLISSWNLINAKVPLKVHDTLWQKMQLDVGNEPYNWSRGIVYSLSWVLLFTGLI